MQLMLGIPLELVHKGFEVGMVYLAGVLAGERCHSSRTGFLGFFLWAGAQYKTPFFFGFSSGSLFSSIFDPLSALVGASGGVYALIGGYFMNAVVVSCLASLLDYLSLRSLSRIFGKIHFKKILVLLPWKASYNNSHKIKKQQAQ